MNKAEIIQQTANFIKTKMSGEGSGHDWWHVYRVWQLAKQIGYDEKADLFIVELGALLHDIADWKFYAGNLEEGPIQARAWLEKLKVDQEIIVQVCDIVKNISFKGAGVKTEMSTIEGAVVQDADRLDAIGAVGIARAFAYGGNSHREIYNPEIKPEQHQSFEAYQKSKGTTVTHFYEKLLLLKDLMNTKTAKEMAAHRHQIMEEFLVEFYQEWEGKK